MLEELMRECRNWFLIPEEVHTGAYSIKNGSIELPFLLDGQYFRICGSVFNDGVYEYGKSRLKDEDFIGAIWPLAVPPAFLALAEEIQNWRDKYEDKANSPFQSESFGGYSYTKSSQNTAESGSAAGWKRVFAGRLAKWRKL